MKKIIKGNLIYTKTIKEFTIIPQGFVVVDENGIIENCYHTLPDCYSSLPIEDYGDQLIIPAFTDAHVHAGQLPIPGILYNTELIEWLNELTIPQEIRLHNQRYAKKVYEKFVEKLIENGIGHAIIMATIHTDSTTILFDALVNAGIKAYVGKVSEDCNTLPDATEDTQEAMTESRRFILENINKSPMVKPILTPTISMICSRPLMQELAKQAKEFNLPVQAHLSENISEGEFALNMYPDCIDFLDTYEKAGLMQDENCVLAHSIHLTQREMETIAHRNMLVAHCPDSNLNLLSGMMNLAKYHDMGIRVGLGSDVSGGHTLNPFQNMVSAIQTGAAQYLTGNSTRPIMAAEAFYCATKGGGSFFGNVGSFEKGYAFDALIIDDSETLEYNHFNLEQRAEKMIYCCDDRNIINIYIDGKKIK